MLCLQVGVAWVGSIAPACHGSMANPEPKDDCSGRVVVTVQPLAFPSSSAEPDATHAVHYKG